MDSNMQRHLAGLGHLFPDHEGHKKTTVGPGSPDVLVIPRDGQGRILDALFSTRKSSMEFSVQAQAEKSCTQWCP